MEKTTFLVYLDEIVKYGNWTQCDNFNFWKALSYCYANADFYLKHVEDLNCLMDSICRMGGFRFKDLKL